MNKVILTGATGFIGTHLVKRLLKENYKITVLTRNPFKKNLQVPREVKLIKWDYKKPSEWAAELNNNEIVIHLAGANIFGKRWNDEYKKIIVQSREVSTRNMVNSISKDSLIKVFISASGSGYYGDTGKNTADEEFPAGTDFLAEVCRRWEAPTHSVDELGIRRINVRNALVFSTKDGYLNRLLLPYKMFIGGPLGGKKFWLSWIHIDDLVETYLHIIKNNNIWGAINAASPNPVQMGEFASSLGNVLKRPALFTIPEFALKIAIGEGGKYVAYNQKVSSEKLQKSGFRFRFPELRAALEDLIKNNK